MIDYPKVRPRCFRDMVVQQVGYHAGIAGRPIEACPYGKHQRRYCWEHGWMLGRMKRAEAEVGVEHEA